MHELSDFFDAVLQTFALELVEQVLRSIKGARPNQVVECLSRT